MTRRLLRPRPIAFVMVIVCVLAGTCGPSAAVLWGIHGDHTWDSNNGRIRSALQTEAAFGSKISRNTLRWNVVQANPFQFDWSKPDYVVNQAEAAGQQVLFVVRAAPPWASGSFDSKVIPTDPTKFTNFVNHYKGFFLGAVQRYGARVKHWEVWTEPNESIYWQPQGLSPSTHREQWIDMYARLFRETRAAVRAVNTSVKISIGALSGLGASCCIRGPIFLDGLINRNVTFEYLAANPHSLRNYAPWECVQFQQSFCDIQLIRDVLVARGRSTVKIWVTEFGWTVGAYTSPGSSTTQIRIPGGFYKLRLWPNSGQVKISGVTRNYSSINRSAMIDTNGNGIPEEHNLLTLTTALPSAPAAKVEVVSPAAEATHATYVREAMKMLKGTYRPASGRPPQNYNYVEVAIYFRSYDVKATFFGMYGLTHEPVPNFDRPGEWFLQARPAAGEFRTVATSK